MNYKKLIGFGVLIWIVTLGGVSIFNDIFKGGLLGGSLLIEISLLMTAAIISYFCGSNLGIASRVTMLKYSISWAIINLSLDTLHREIIGSWTVSRVWEFWFLGDLAIFIVISTVPLLAVKKLFRP